ncbi:hypothetical protein A2690_04480 [Candidatus Roizmanbacteria bacterium RIFCSPHIGHO2_01_FULL_39_12b]|uniref:Cohesin domain-containing protein n=1 Tax=Candidatus Roizmanbacteria bacterium RIFCSPHIGHO2_01_FULL_39_12b TaxID=1802030 RepID=A0A1F7GAB1_9BACT|nr:MAG: hypothetical protein A2690_04480 [Candidatus Roizmanbacteria bacterium RIFCSPHIGHO2_01_FULL_39_12b]
MEEQDNTKRWVILIGMTVLVLVILGIFILKSAYKESKRTVSEKLMQTQEQSASQLKTKSGFRLKILNKNPIKVGDNVRLGVYANSGEFDAVGFDLALKYSKSIVYVSSESKLEGYDVIETVEPNSMGAIITGAKQIGNTKKNIWADTQIMILTFKAQKRGLSTVSFDLSPNSVSDTNLFSHKNEDLVTIAIGSTVEIQ